MKKRPRRADLKKEMSLVNRALTIGVIMSAQLVSSLTSLYLNSFAILKLENPKQSNNGQSYKTF